MEQASYLSAWNESLARDKFYYECFLPKGQEGYLTLEGKIKIKSLMENLNK
jgi:hypothetical protein